MLIPEQTRASEQQRRRRKGYFWTCLGASCGCRATACTCASSAMSTLWQSFNRAWDRMHVSQRKAGELVWAWLPNQARFASSALLQPHRAPAALLLCPPLATAAGCDLCSEGSAMSVHSQPPHPLVQATAVAVAAPPAQYS